MKFRAGCDPEVFMQDNTGKFISVIGKVKGNKQYPLQVDYLPNGFTLQQDNVSLEFGIPPAANKKEFIEHIQKVKEAGLNYLKGLSFSSVSCAIFPEDQMRDAEAHIFGCEPDFNAWSGRKNKKPEPPHPFMRSAGGHVHVETNLDKRSVVRTMDLRISVPAVLMDNGEQRKQLYGKAGAYRPKSYGVEYRTPSNFWIFSPKLIGWVWDETSKALDMVANGSGCTDPRVRACIDKNDKSLAEKLIKEYNLVVV